MADIPHPHLSRLPYHTLPLCLAVPDVRIDEEGGVRQHGRAHRLGDGTCRICDGLAAVDNGCM